MAAPVSSPPTINFSIRQDPNTNTVHVSYGAKRYTVQVLQLNGSNTQEVTGLRDWTTATRIVLDYLKEELNSPFDFNRMKRADIAFRGDVALNGTTHFPNPQPTVITNIRWSRDITQQPTEDVPLTSRSEGLDKLRRLGIELATYRSLSPTPQRPPIQPPPAPQPNPPTPQPPPLPQPRTTLIHDAGGGGDCGPNSIAHQLTFMPGHQKTPQQLRNDVSQYFNTDRVINDPLLRGYIFQSLEEEQEENLRLNQKAFADAATITGDQAAQDLHNFRNADQLNLSEADVEVLLRRILNYRKERLNMNGAWVDKDFFYILGQLGTPIAIIRRDGNQHAIDERFPSNQPIDRDRTVWIYYNGTRTSGGGHFQSFHRDRVEFLQWLDQLLLENRNRDIAHLCAQIQDKRVLFNFGSAEQQNDAVTSIRQNIIDFRNKHPEAFTRAINLMKEHNPALPFDAANFAAENDAHCQELLNNAYVNILTAQNLMNA